MKSLAGVLNAAKSKPLVKAHVVLNKKVVAVNTLTKDMLVYLDAFRKTAVELIVAVIADPTWQVDQIMFWVEIMSCLFTNTNAGHCV